MSSHENAQSGNDPTPGLAVYGRGVRTALRNNATAYGFSISITTAYGLVGTRPAGAIEIMSFAAGAAVAFVIVGAVFVASFGGRLDESGQVVTISGGVDLLSVIAATATAFAISRIPGPWAWPLTAGGTVVVYLLVGGLDVVIARSAARRSRFGRAQ